MMNEREIINFISLQEMLMKAFFIAYPSLKDFDFLLDFPKKGTVFLMMINGVLLNMVKVLNF
ncbi:hypothetical protein [Pectobacterium versatile]|uniref:hypothetical protein n=1 Tax=Pectobacterium versatile TaxID=2488639 RepID=UPI001F387E4B|nr:hypothetical protein [Pectobacterium versatile]